MAGRRSFFREEDLKVLSQYSPTSNEFNTRLQEILDTPRETKKNVSKKSLSRLMDKIGRLRGGKKVKAKPCRKPTIDRCRLIQDIITLQLNSASERDIKCLVKQKFKEGSGGKSPHRNTIFNILEQCKPDIEAGCALLLLCADDKHSSNKTDIEAANALKQIPASPIVLNEEFEAFAVERLSKRAKAKNDLNPVKKVVKKTTKKRKISIGKQSSLINLNLRSSKRSKKPNGILLADSVLQVENISNKKLSTVMAKGLERIPASPVVLNEEFEAFAVERLSKKEKAKNDLNPVIKVVKKTTKKRKISIGKKSSKKSKEILLADSALQIENMSNRKLSTELAKGLERIPASPVVLNEDFGSSAIEELPKEISAIGKDDGNIQSSNVTLNDDFALIPKRSYREAIRVARLLLSPGDQPEPVHRESKVLEITDAVINSLNTIDRGKVEKMGTAARAKLEGVNRFLDEIVGNDENVLNIYVCGSPGLGKTLCIEKVLRGLEARLEAETISVPHSNSIPVFKVIRLQGTTVQTSNEFYNVLATRLHLQSGDPRSAVLSLFRSPSGIGTCRQKNSTTVLFIDEIDRAPIAAIREVLEIAGAAVRQSEEEEESWVKAGPYNCNVIVIGAANNRLFCENVGISYCAQQCIYRCCFEPYASKSLFNILKRRTEGLFDYSALKLLSLKVACEGGDVRFLLQLADRCLVETTNKLRRQIDNREAYKSCNDITAVPCSGPNPLENWEGECEVFV